jgi:hypothetical protein
MRRRAQTVLGDEKLNLTRRSLQNCEQLFHPRRIGPSELRGAELPGVSGLLGRLTPLPEKSTVRWCGFFVTGETLPHITAHRAIPIQHHCP